MSQDAIDDVLVLNTGDDLYRSNARTETSTSILKTRLSRWAQDIATCRSAGERTSVLAIRFAPLPRLAGVTNPRQR
jgi:hypothetical protein